jgi:peptidoglycan/LPS O-acetylase OafA/YrhL
MENEISTPISRKTSFRYDINALRAIAVLGVIFFHFNVPYFTGGFSGVDIFFVISGYLMCKIVFNGLEAEGFSIIDFYKKRINRIVPALSVMILSTLFITFFMFLPSDYTDETKNAISSMLFYSNMLYAKSNYFDPASENNIFLHTWSLSVEWQFYLILPVAIIFINKVVKNNKTKYLILLTGAALLFFIGSVIFTKMHPTGSFYLLPTRSWEMLIGGIAFLLDGKIKWINNKGVAILGYILVIGCLFGLNSEMAWPGYYTLLPVLGTFLIITCNCRSFEIIKHSIIEFTGKISYSLYLWHWPIFVIATYLGYSSQTLIPIFLIISFFLAYLSFRFVESSRLITTRKVLFAASSLTVVMFAIFKFGGNSMVFKNQTLELANYDANHEKQRALQFNLNSCFFPLESDSSLNKSDCLTFVPDHKNFILIGDSHAAHISQSLRESFNRDGYNLMQASASICKPIIKSIGAKSCTQIMHFMYGNFIPVNAKNIDGVIISAYWESVKNKEQDLNDIKETIKYLRNINVPVIVIGDNETYTIPFSSIAARDFQYSTNLSNRYLNVETVNISNFLKANLGEYYVDILNLKGIVKVYDGKVPYMFDKNHLTKYGADRVTENIMRDPKFIRFLNLKHS